MFGKSSFLSYRCTSHLNMNEKCVSNNNLKTSREGNNCDLYTKEHPNTLNTEDNIMAFFLFFIYCVYRLVDSQTIQTETT